MMKEGFVSVTLFLKPFSSNAEGYLLEKLAIYAFMQA